MAGYSVEYEAFDSFKEILFNFTQHTCSLDGCENISFIQCAYCRKVICLNCFLSEYHYHYQGEELNNEDIDDNEETDDENINN